MITLVLILSAYSVIMTSLYLDEKRKLLNLRDRYTRPRFPKYDNTNKFLTPFDGGC